MDGACELFTTSWNTVNAKHLEKLTFVEQHIKTTIPSPTIPVFVRVATCLYLLTSRKNNSLAIFYNMM